MYKLFIQSQLDEYKINDSSNKTEDEMEEFL
jgi:hypothetical protein